jgi:hypothetical protein
MRIVRKHVIGLLVCLALLILLCGCASAPLARTPPTNFYGPVKVIASGAVTSGELVIMLDGNQVADFTDGSAVDYLERFDQSGAHFYQIVLKASSEKEKEYDISVLVSVYVNGSLINSRRYDRSYHEKSNYDSQTFYLNFEVHNP